MPVSGTNGKLTNLMGPVCAAKHRRAGKGEVIDVEDYCFRHVIKQFPSGGNGFGKDKVVCEGVELVDGVAFGRVCGD